MKFIDTFLWNIHRKKIEDLKTQKLDKPGFISRYHNFPAITGANNV